MTTRRGKRTLRAVLEDIESGEISLEEAIQEAKVQEEQEDNENASDS